MVLAFLVAALAVGAAAKVIRGRRAPAPPEPATLEYDLTAPKPPADAASLLALTKPEKINVNAADVAELCELPGVGECYAGRIVAYREEHGPFEEPEELLAVKGIGPATLEKMRPHITCETGK
ncbi:MAG: helix-hairpin-helix domain-containing protein [Candidatus Coatesbacteria bacterium]|nr:MAG: helix-hairpin-helix domain-containing protein [Candidatus Coatesbacteria bacterium]